MPRKYNTSLTPEQLQERARKAGQAANSTDTLIKRLVDRADKLTEDQFAALATILAGPKA